jgi:hypothetical protein
MKVCVTDTDLQLLMWAELGVVRQGQPCFL